MKNPILVIAACLALFSTQFVSANEETFAIDSISTNKVRFESLSIEYVEGSPILAGKVKKKSYNTSVLSGHVDYIIKDSNGAVIVEGGVQYRPSLALRRWKYGSSFSIELPKDLPADATIQVGFHRNSYKPETNSPVAQHTENKLL